MRSGSGSGFGRRRDLFTHRSAARRRGLLVFVAILVAMLAVAVAARPNTGVSGAAGGPSAHPSPTNTGPFPANIPLKHIVFIVKENRTFDNYFGRYPGADGATTGKVLGGRTIPLKTAPDVQPHDITHGFNAGILSIDGGKMDGFNTILDGTDLSGYDQFTRSQMPHYWAYADHYVLSDRFFTSMY